MLSALFVKDNIVHFAAAFCLAGYLCRDQLLLRVLIIVGDCIYVLYYLLAPATPLWGGIFWAAVFAAVNALMIARIMADRAHFGMNDEEYELFMHLGALTPGEFRRMMRVGRWQTATDMTTLTNEGEVPDRLYFVIAGNGGLHLEKAGKKFSVAAGTFIGEIAFLLSRPATATVQVESGTRYISWEVAQLKRMLLRAPSLRIALNGALNRDMAMKVARA